MNDMREQQGTHPAWPEQYDRSNSSCIVPIHCGTCQQALLGLNEMSECRTKGWVDHRFCDGQLICVICRDVRTVRCNNDCEGQGIRETHDAREHRAELPGKADRLALVSFGPEQVEKESRSKYRCNIDADEDVVGGDADKIIVVNSGGIMKLLYQRLLLDIV